MKVQKYAQAGSLESGDLLVTVSPRDEGIEIRIDSPVKHMFGDQLQKEITEILEKFQIESGQFKIVDKGALPYAVRARVETAIKRAIS